MKSNIVYVEQTNGSSHDGMAWIGKCFYSKSGLSIYFNGKVFKKGQSFSGNHFDIETGEDYWISKVKKNAQDRHRFGNGIINIDKSVVEEYLKFIGEESLQKNKFKIVELDNLPAKEVATEIENQKYDPIFNSDLSFKNPKDLTESELNDLMEYYKDFDLPEMYKKSRKLFKQKIEDLKLEFERRNMTNLA